MSGYSYLILKYSFVVLVASIIFMGGFGTYAFAEKLTIQSPELSLGSNHLGSMIKTQTVSSDGSIWIFLTATEPIEREHMTINVRFTDQNGKQLNHINYDITAVQNGQELLSKTMIHQHTGIGDHLTQELISNDNVDIKITLQGIGMNPPFTGPQGESIQINVIPEFGMISVMTLTVAIISVIGISAKSRMMIH